MRARFREDKAAGLFRQAKRRRRSAATSIGFGGGGGGGEQVEPADRDVKSENFSDLAGKSDTVSLL
jgi:hypothetical protein